MKKCPMCAEEVQDEAKKCKHCGEVLEKPPAVNPFTMQLNAVVMLGILTILAGLGAFGYAMVMDTTVDAGPMVGRVSNIHLMNAQKNYQIGGIVAMIFGGLGVFSGVKFAHLFPSGESMDPEKRQWVGLVGVVVIVVCALIAIKAAI